MASTDATGATVDHFHHTGLLWDPNNASYGSTCPRVASNVRSNKPTALNLGHLLEVARSHADNPSDSMGYL